MVSFRKELSGSLKPIEINGRVVSDDISNIQFLWKLLVNRPEEERISSNKEVTYIEHEQFATNHPYRSWLILENHGLPIGAAYTTFNNEISIKLIPTVFSNELFRASLDYVLRQQRPLPAKPSVRPNNYVINVNPKDERTIEALRDMNQKVIQLTFSLQGNEQYECS